MQVFPDVESQPLQLVKVEPPAAVGVRVTDVPVVYEAEHVLGQVMPAGELETVPAPLPAVVTVKLKPVEHGCVVEAVFRGDAAPVAKSLLLLSVSVQPDAALRAAVVLVRVAVGAPSEQLVPEPYPTRSITLAPPGHAVPEVIKVWLLRRATFPAPAAIAIPLPAPIASGVGRFVVPPAPACSCMR